MRRPTDRLVSAERELAGVRHLLYELRHNRKRWPRKWVTGMLRHYEEREAKLRADVSRLKRAK